MSQTLLRRKHRPTPNSGAYLLISMSPRDPRLEVLCSPAHIYDCTLLLRRSWNKDQPQARLALTLLLIVSVDA